LPLALTPTIDRRVGAVGAVERSVDGEPCTPRPNLIAPEVLDELTLVKAALVVAGPVVKSLHPSTRVGDRRIRRGRGVGEVWCVASLFVSAAFQALAWLPVKLVRVMRWPR